MNDQYINMKFEVTLLIKEAGELNGVEEGELSKFIEEVLIEELKDVAIVGVKAV